MRVSANFMELLRRHRDFRESLIAGTEGIEAPLPEFTSDSKMARLRRMVASVRREIHTARSFVRLAPIGDRVLYGYLRTEHRIGDIVASILARRFPGVVIILGNSEECWIAMRTKHGSLSLETSSPLTRTVETFRRAVGGDTDGEDIEYLWKAYYKSQYEPRRRNPTVFRSRMPAKVLRNTQNSVVSRGSGCTLDDFCEPD